MKVVFDSSAFAKRYIEEAGSEDVDALLQQTDQLGLSILCVPEIISALNRRRREQRLTDEQYRQIKVALSEDVADANILDLTPAVIQQTIHLLEQHMLRGMDALHLACALVWQADLFVSADKRQLTAAQRAGLTVHQV